MYAEAKNIGITTNMEAEIVEVEEALKYCNVKGISHIILETDSLSLRNMILKEWKIPWNVVEENGRNSGYSGKYEHSGQTYI